MEGNRMKMREALGDVYNILEKIQSFTPRLNDISLMREFRSKICHAKRVIDSALSAPARNCDVGTAEEQIKRWEEFCIAHHEYWKPSVSLTAIQRCNCPCQQGNGCNYFIWAQMPYTKAEGGL